MSPAGAAQRLSPETWALLACAQAVVDERRLPEFRAALTACTSAERLCSAAVRHGMLGHLHRQVGRLDAGSIDVSVADRVAELYRASVERNLRQTAQLLRLLQRFGQRGIEAVPIKGPAWGERLYGDATLRNSVDLDLLVPYKHVAQVRQELLASGFSDGVWFNERLLRPEWRVWGEMPFVMPGAGRMVDVHWRMTVGQGESGITAEEVMTRSRPLTLLGREVRTPSDADMVLITCVHGTRHRWDGVEMLLSLAVQVRDLAAAAWPGIMAAARQAGSARRVTIAVAHVCRVFSLDPPPDVAGSLERDPVARWLLGSLTPETLCSPDGELEATDPSHLLWTLATEDGAWASLTHAAERLWRPGAEDWESVALPESLEWLYYPLRPARLALKWPRLLARMSRTRGAGENR